MTIETPADLVGLQRVGEVVARVLQRMLAAVEPGISTAELDSLGERLLEGVGARSAPRLACDFPGATCISINEEAAHGIPGPRRIQAGDVVNIDVSAELDGFFADTGSTLVVPPISPTASRLCRAGRQALDAAMREARDGARLNRIGQAIQRVAKKSGFLVIRNLCSHGVGRALHEEPASIPGYYDPQDQRILREGMVITIEPFLSTASRYAFEGDDGWTLRGDQGGLSAQFEHSLIITRGEPIVTTRLPEDRG
jgi:methionyl aminopeptidase